MAKAKTKKKVAKKKKKAKKKVAKKSKKTAKKKVAKPPEKDEPPLTETQQTMMQGLERRKTEAEGIEKVNNAALWAGSDMYYYCRACGLLAARLPEGHWERPPKNCEPCQAMVDVGFDPGAGQFG